MSHTIASEDIALLQAVGFFSSLLHLIYRGRGIALLYCSLQARCLCISRPVLLLKVLIRYLLPNAWKLPPLFRLYQQGQGPGDRTGFCFYFPYLSLRYNFLGISQIRLQGLLVRPVPPASHVPYVRVVRTSLGHVKFLRFSWTAVLRDDSTSGIVLTFRYLVTVIGLFCVG